MRNSSVLSVVLLIWAVAAHAGIVFDGTDDYSLADGSATFDFADTTFTVVIRFKATTTGATAYLAAKRSLAVTEGGYFIRISTGGVITARILDNVAAEVATRSTTSTTALDGSWHSVAVVFTTDTSVIGNNTISIYYDGALDQGSLTTTSANPYVTCPGCTLSFGAVYDPTGYLNGEIASVHIFSGALSAAQAEGMHKAALGGVYTAQSVATFSLSQCADGTSGNGVALQDLSGNGHTVTPNDGANNTGTTCTGSSTLAWPVGAH